MFAETAVACSLLISPFDEGKTVEEESDCDPPEPLEVAGELRDRANKTKHAPYKDGTTKRYAKYLAEERRKNEELEKELRTKDEEIDSLLNEIKRLKEEDVDDIRNNSPNNVKSVRDDEGTNVEEKEDDKVNGRDNSIYVTNNSTNNDDHSTTNGDAELIEVEATFYTAMCDTGCTGTTATGLDVKDTIYTDEGNRIIAVDPNVIPLGSMVKITLEDGTTFTASAEDTGGGIRGNRIDVLVESREDAERLGRQSAEVEVIS